MPEISDSKYQELVEAASRVGQLEQALKDAKAGMASAEEKGKQVLSDQIRQIKEERDELRAKVREYEPQLKEREKSDKEIKEKLEKLSKLEAEDLERKKTAALKSAFETAELPTGNHGLAVKLLDLASIELTDDGKLKDADAVGESVKSLMEKHPALAVNPDKPDPSPRIPTGPNTGAGATDDKSKLSPQDRSALAAKGWKDKVANAKKKQDF